MSFLTRVSPVVRIAARPSTRVFSTTIAQRKTATDTVKDAVKGVDRAVSDTLVKGIDKGVEAKDAVASTAGVNASEAKGKADELAGQAKGKAAEVSGQAKGKAEELKGEAKAKM